MREKFVRITVDMIREAVEANKLPLISDSWLVVEADDQEQCGVCALTHLAIHKGLDLQHLRQTKSCFRGSMIMQYLEDFGPRHEYLKGFVHGFDLSGDVFMSSTNAFYIKMYNMGQEDGVTVRKALIEEAGIQQ